MSAFTEGWVWKHSPYKGVAFTIHLAIGDVVNDAYGFEFFMTSANLATKCRCGRSAVTAALAAFIADGYLEVMTGTGGGGRGKATHYRFLMPKPSVDRAVSDEPAAPKPPADRAVSEGSGGPETARSEPETARSTVVNRAICGIAHIPNKKEELKEPAAVAEAPTADAETLPGIEPARKSLRERDPTVAVAHDLVKRVFANRREKPLSPFLRVRKRAVECLEAGWSVEKIEEVMMQPDCVFTNPGIQTQAAMMNNRGGRESPIEQVARLAGYGRSADAGSRSDAGRGTDPVGLAEENPRRDSPRLEGAPGPPERRAGDGGGA